MLKKRPEPPVALRIARLLSDGSVWTAPQLATALGISPQCAQRATHKMLARGYLRVVGLSSIERKSGTAARTFALGPVVVEIAFDPDADVGRGRPTAKRFGHLPESERQLSHLIDAMVRHRDDR